MSPPFFFFFRFHAVVFSIRLWVKRLFFALFSCMFSYCALSSVHISIRQSTDESLNRGRTSLLKASTERTLIAVQPFVFSVFLFLSFFPSFFLSFILSFKKQFISHSSTDAANQLRYLVNEFVYIYISLHINYVCFSMGVHAVCFQIPFFVA
jgi:hypothetical protein